MGSVFEPPRHGGTKFLLFILGALVSWWVSFFCLSSCLWRSIMARRKRRCQVRARRRSRAAALRRPCFRAFLRARFLPSSVFGPVDCRQGWVWRQRAAWARRLSGGQPFVFTVNLPDPSVRLYRFFDFYAEPAGHRASCGIVFAPAGRGPYIRR